MEKKTYRFRECYSFQNKMSFKISVRVQHIYSTVYLVVVVVVAVVFIFCLIFFTRHPKTPLFLYCFLFVCLFVLPDIQKVSVGTLSVFGLLV